MVSYISANLIYELLSFGTYEHEHSKQITQCDADVLYKELHGNRVWKFCVRRQPSNHEVLREMEELGKILPSEDEKLGMNADRI